VKAINIEININFFTRSESWEDVEDGLPLIVVVAVQNVERDRKQRTDKIGDLFIGQFFVV
jgi:hypothetical protein